VRLVERLRALPGVAAGSTLIAKPVEEIGVIDVEWEGTTYRARCLPRAPDLPGERDVLSTFRNPLYPSENEMTFEEASAWCTEQGVRIERLGSSLLLSLGEVSVNDALPREDWDSWRATFLGLVERLRQRRWEDEEQPTDRMSLPDAFDESSWGLRASDPALHAPRDAGAWPVANCRGERRNRATAAESAGGRWATSRIRDPHAA
jgi:hypothetical protein